jgi:ubiquinone/menaquinone biosynthesis C-methylase UbiE
VVIVSLALIGNIKRYIKKNFFTPDNEKGAAEAYNLWSSSYDHQPGNLMLDLDEEIFSDLLSSIDIRDKVIADIGCGTGRHWPKILSQSPKQLIGCDVSYGMLKELNKKFPGSHTEQIIDNSLSFFEDKSCDVIISTLTVAHIEDIEDALGAWSRVLKNKSDLIITDFHPALLSSGGKRTFQHEHKPISIRNFVHSLDTIKNILFENKFKVIRKEKRVIDGSVKHYYEMQNALHVFEKFKGLPVIYGMHLKRSNGIE